MKKAKKIIGIIKHLNRYLPLKSLDQMYTGMARAHLEYCDFIYHYPPLNQFLPDEMARPSLLLALESCDESCNFNYHLPTSNQFFPGEMSLSTLMGKVESVQYQAALAVTGAWKGTSRLKIYNELGWEALSSRRSSRRILQLHKILDKKTPSYLYNKLPSNRQALIVLPYVFQEYDCRTLRYRNSFYPDAINLWNRMIQHFEHFPTYSELKKYLQSLFRPKPNPTYDIFDPYLRHIFQLRVGLSKLRHDKKRHNFADTITDTCSCNQGIEDSKHYFLDCPYYLNHRNTLLTSVNQILNRYELDINDFTHLLLYGHANITDVDNKAILTLTIDYLKNTQRFEP